MGVFLFVFYCFFLLKINVFFRLIEVFCFCNFLLNSVLLFLLSFL